MSAVLSIVAILLFAAFIVVHSVERGWIARTAKVAVIADYIPRERHDGLLAAGGALLLAAFLCWIAGA